MYNLTRLRNEMLKRGWTETYLAKRARVGQATVNRMFKVGSAHPKSIEAVAKALGIDLEQIITQEKSA